MCFILFKYINNNKTVFLSTYQYKLSKFLCSCWTNNVKYIKSNQELFIHTYTQVYNNNNHIYSHIQLHVHGTYKALSTKLQLH